VSQENGAVTVPKYAAVHDAGRINNPMLGEGQVQGGIAQGLGQAHLEGMVYSEDWQLSTMGWAVRLTRLGVPHEFYSYPEADHAFMDYNRDRYQKEASDVAWPRTLEFFSAHFKGVTVR